MLGLMHDGNPRGHLRVGQVSLTTAAQVGRICGGSAAEVAPLLAELEAAGVFSRTEDGTIFCRRMVREAHISEVRREAGAKGGAVAHANRTAKTELTTAVADADADPGKKRKAAPKLHPRDFDTLWTVWERKVSKGAARRAFDKVREANEAPAIDDLVRIVTVLQSSHEWTRDGRIYQPYLATWLNREGWEDELPKSHGKVNGTHFTPAEDPHGYLAERTADGVPGARETAARMERDMAIERQWEKEHASK